ncbi:MAG TPA: hypothetical protein VHS31_09775 [Tepidisphaeraceae bacterium]|nr:hypothetical protein [Tepidisphaeraceae bacterium]
MSKAHTPWETVAASTIDLERALEVTEDDVAPAEAPKAVRQPRPAPSGGGLFTIPLLCLGIGIIACCVLIPAADENRKLVYQHEKLQADLDQITHQTDVNSEFLKRVADDPTLSERLAQRQMKMVRQGTSVLELKGQFSSDQVSPFDLVTLPPPPEMPPYQPVGGRLASICRDPHLQLYLMGAGLLLVAAGLVLGSGEKRDDLQLDLQAT